MCLQMCRGSFQKSIQPQSCTKYDNEKPSTEHVRNDTTVSERVNRSGKENSLECNDVIIYIVAPTSVVGHKHEILI